VSRECRNLSVCIKDLGLQTKDLIYKVFGLYIPPVSYAHMADFFQNLSHILVGQRPDYVGGKDQENSCMEYPNCKGLKSDTAVGKNLVKTALFDQ